MSTENSSFINLARCYSNVFRGAPWEEAFKDLTNGNFISLEKGGLDWNKKGLQLAYPLLPTARYIEDESSKPDSVLIIIPDSEKTKRVIGFGWGYAAESTQTLVAEKWSNTNPDDQEVLREIIDSNCAGETPWYLSEVGVLPEFQGQRIGSSIVEDLIGQVLDRPIIMRTNEDSPMVRIAENNGFKRVVGQGTNCIDPINYKRVLFVRRPR